jgi:predicted metalloendopeptidase
MLPPYYDAAQNQALNYAGYNTLGHEMTHGFDLHGANFDKYGDLGSIWANAADEVEFKRRAALLVQCYSSFDVLPNEMPGVKANGEATITENIADLGGTEIAYQAYLNRLKADGFNGDQLKLQKQRFFRGYADEYRSKYGKEFVNQIAFGIKPDGSKVNPDAHSLNKERVNGVVSNMDGWYDAFDIKEGALFRAPADRIHIW